MGFSHETNEGLAVFNHCKGGIEHRVIGIGCNWEERRDSSSDKIGVKRQKYVGCPEKKGFFASEIWEGFTDKNGGFSPVKGTLDLSG